MFRPRGLHGLSSLIRRLHGQHAVYIALIPVRGKKTSTTVKLSELPEGPIRDDSLQPEPVRRKKTSKRVKVSELPEGCVGNDSSEPQPTRRKKTTRIKLSELPLGPVQDESQSLEPARGKKTSTVKLSELPESSKSPGNDESPSLEPARGKKTTTFKLSELPQGPIHDESSPPETTDNGNLGPPYPTVMLQAWRNMRKFDNCVLLTRVGGFYELYFEHASEYAPLLNLKLTTKKTNAGPVPMAGFPFFQLDRYLKILVQDLNRYVAIAEETPNDAANMVKMGGLMHDRKVTRIITPGTLIDENFIDPYFNNYVLAIHVGQQDTPDAGQLSGREALDCGIATPPVVDSAPLGLAWLDLSTGHFFTQLTNVQSLSAALSRIGPREIVLDQDFQKNEAHAIFTILAEDRHFITYSQQGALTDVNEWSSFLEEDVPDSTRDSFTDHEVMAGGLLLNYVKDRLQGMSIKLQPPQRRDGMEVMSIDKNSLRALEIKQTMRDGLFRGSLLHAIRRTVTKSGARLLNDWLSAPSTSLDVINQRLNLVAYFIAHPDLCDSIIQLLRRSHDAQRLVQKFALGRGDADDLLALANTIRATDDIVSLLKPTTDQHQEPNNDESCLEPLVARIDLEQPLKLAQRIKDAIDEESIVYQQEVDESEASDLLTLAQDIVASEGSQEDASLLPKTRKKRPSSLRDYYGDDNEAWIMKPAASPPLEQLHADLNLLTDEKTALESKIRDQLSAPSLSLKWNPGLGHFAHIKGRDARTMTDVKALSSSRSTRSFHLPEWTALGQRLDQARFRIRREEQRVFQSLRQHVILNLVKLRRNSVVLDQLDIVSSFAKLAAHHDLIRPLLNNSDSHTIIGGRHPTVEGGLLARGRTFVRNDCLVGGGGGPPKGGLVWLITGPNMAGKSTFLRQNALITVLAQIGSYVPASFAEMGIVDAIFSRVGSADNLFGDQSTFMVEMVETAQILRQATARSFVIMDEIGRGTTPEDGTAVAYACLHHLATVNRCRTLFATHFHDVIDLAAEEGLCDPTGVDAAAIVQTYCTDVQEDGKGGFVYVHKLRKGVNRRSHALKVARLAGLPESAIEAAQRVLTARLEGDGGSRGGDVMESRAADAET
ncbi:hypothetical protein CDD80_3970 [Ophiocordyceps camponoti-rufipedis]|uniref:DNA mismatch repair protein n=1 Tax=Ophiocordyceps camponoti-rufipedis TaxID=2004952 RepID=A0A2C5ZFC6_9HYPO|nr:hypothetical protein CDD80_3970 [Ophiocordyceps camponoti-rufipedis]